MSHGTADGRRYELPRIRLADGRETTVYAVVHPRRATRVRVTCHEQARRLDHRCVANGRPEAIVAGFFVRDPWRPLGEVSLAELARLLVSLGATEAINLDRGGSATLVHRGHLLNRPYSSVDQPGPESRPVVSALLFDALPGG